MSGAALRTLTRFLVHHDRLNRAVQTIIRSHYWWTWAFVGAVSLYDGCLVVAYRSMIRSTEKNPVGKLLIELDSGGITYFLAAKFAGTVVVLLALVEIHRVLHRYRDWIIGGVASFQAWLLWYLSFSGLS